MAIYGWTIRMIPTHCDLAASISWTEDHQRPRRVAADDLEVALQYSLVLEQMDMGMSQVRILLVCFRGK